MGTLLQDIRYGYRMLVKSPTVTLVAALTLALGIGANTAIFSTMNGLFLRPLPVANADRLMAVAGQVKGTDGGYGVSYLDYRELRGQTSQAFSDVLAYNLNLVAVDYQNQADSIVVSFVSDNYFTALGLKPAAGQLIYGAAAEERGHEPVIVLGNGYWKRRFNADPNIVGQQIKINGHSATVLGVAPEGFHGLYSLIDMQAFLPMGIRTMWSDKQDFWTKRDNRDLKVFGVLKPGVSMKEAQSVTDVVMNRLAAQYPEDKNFSARLYPEKMARPEPDPSNGTAIAAIAFMSLAGLVLLLACTNVVNIVLVRSTTRAREMAIRAALGAARVRLVRQMITESTLLAMLGGIGGMMLGAWVSHLLGSIQIVVLGSPLLFDFPFDWRVFASGLLAAMITGVLVGMAPAMKASRTDLNQVLHEGSRGVVAGSNRSWLRSGLVMTQVACSLTLLVVTGLFVRSARNAEKVFLGFDPTHVLNATLDTRNLAFDKARARRFYRELEERMRQIPGVQSATIATTVPMGVSSSNSHVYVEGQSADRKDAVPDIRFNNVGVQYFETLRVPLVRGRVFTEQDNDKAPLVAVVNEYMAQKYWPKQDVLGKRFSMEGPAGPFIEVVGVSKQGKYTGPAEDPTPFFYLPMEQNNELTATIQLRTSGAPEALSQDMVREVHALAPSLPIVDIESMEHVLEGVNGLFLYRMATKFSAALGLVGLLLAMVGVYGVISYAASQRTHEIGVRMALGASRGSIMNMVLRQGFFLIGGGLVAGIALSVLVGSVIKSMLLNVSSADPLTLMVAVLLLGGVGFLASLIPARRAMNVEPLRALRYD
jgi:putative ABC transport system permease protein